MTYILVGIVDPHWFQTFNADPDPAINRNADPDPGSLTIANPDSSQILLLSKKVKFLHEKNSKQVKG
jgi:hypothetical protein